MLHENDFEVTKDAGPVCHRRRHGFPDTVLLLPYHS
jgi:hypothetical protein